MFKLIKRILSYKFTKLEWGDFGLADTRTELNVNDEVDKFIVREHLFQDPQFAEYWAIKMEKELLNNK